MIGDISTMTALGENIVSSMTVTNSARHRSKGRQRSEFSIIIAATYFIPGVTGRARCLQGCAPKPKVSLANRGIAKTPRLPPTTGRPGKRGPFPESPSNSWDVERRSTRSLRTMTSTAIWAETASFLRLDKEQEQHGDVSNQALVACTVNPKGGSQGGQSDCCNHSFSTPTTIWSDFYSASAKTTGVGISNQPENKHINHVENESKSMTAVIDKWKQYKCEDLSAERRLALNEELCSIQSLLARQRVRVLTHALASSTRQGTRNKNAMISYMCRANSTRTLCKQSFQNDEKDRLCRSSRNLDDFSSIDLPPLTVTFKSRTRCK